MHVRKMRYSSYSFFAVMFLCTFTILSRNWVMYSEARLGGTDSNLAKYPVFGGARNDLFFHDGILVFKDKDPRADLLSGELVYSPPPRLSEKAVRLCWGISSTHMIRSTPATPACFARLKMENQRRSYGFTITKETRKPIHATHFLAVPETLLSSVITIYGHSYQGSRDRDGFFWNNGMLMMQPEALAISHDTKHAYIVDATAHRLRKMSLDWRDHTSGDVTLRSVPRDFHSTKSWHRLALTPMQGTEACLSPETTRTAQDRMVCMTAIQCLQFADSRLDWFRIIFPGK